MMTYRVFESTRMRNWAKSLKRRDGDAGRTRVVQHHPDIKIDTSLRLLHAGGTNVGRQQGRISHSFNAILRTVCIELSVCGD